MLQFTRGIWPCILTSRRDNLCRFEVAKELWNMLLAKCGELRHMKYEPLGSWRCSGRYMPYSNVDSFLKVSSSDLALFQWQNNDTAIYEGEKTLNETNKKG